MSATGRTAALHRLRAAVDGDIEAQRLLAELIARMPVLTPSARRRALLDVRDDLLRSIARRFFSHLGSISRQAHYIALYLAHYRARAWAGESALQDCPAHYIDQLEGELWRVLKLVDVPLSSEHVRRILGAKSHVHAQPLDTRKPRRKSVEGSTVADRGGRGEETRS